MQPTLSMQRNTVYALLLGGLLATALTGCKKDDGGGTEDMAISVGDGGGGDGGDDLSVNGNGDGGAADLSSMGIPLDAFPDGGVVIIVDDGGATRVCVVTACAGKVYLCGNCLDDDNDGLTDSDDPDCLGPCQNNEAGFEGNIPGQNNAPCKADCYWDKDSGGGGDACSWSHKCDPFEEGGTGFDPKTAPEIGCTYDPNAKVPGATVPSGQKDCEYLKDNQTTQCTNYCAPLTPNGCDCFGCCENPNDPGHFVYAGSVNASGQGTCSAKASDLDDPTRCKPCTPVAGNCYKQCDRCELCFGKTTVPADCVQTQMPDMFGQAPPDLMGVTVDMVAPPMQCPAGVPACGLPGQPDCGTGGYCISGCCVFTIP